MSSLLEKKTQCSKYIFCTHEMSYLCGLSHKHNYRITHIAGCIVFCQGSCRCNLYYSYIFYM